MRTFFVEKKVLHENRPFTLLGISESFQVFQAKKNIQRNYIKKPGVQKVNKFNKLQNSNKKQIT